MWPTGKEDKTDAEYEREELAVCSQKATELMKLSIQAVRDICDANPTLSNPSDYSQYVQAHMRATCQFLNVRKQEELRDAVDSSDSGAFDTADQLKSLNKAFKAYAARAVDLSERIADK